jgi:hypothetical protein
MAADGRSLRRRGLVVNEDGRFISGPAVIGTFHDKRLICRRFYSRLMRFGVLLPQPEMAEDAFYGVGFMN